MARVCTNESEAVHTVVNIRLRPESVCPKNLYLTNWLRFCHMVSMFKGQGLSVELPRVERWKELPRSRKSLSFDFTSHDEDDLLVCRFDTVLRCKG